MKISNVTLELFAWDDIPATSYGSHTGRFVGRSDLNLMRIQTDEGPQTRTVDLSNVRTNGTFPAGIFAFKVPNGVKVVDQ